ncbi:Transcriptional regulator, LuxR family protein [Nostocoides japonicum T1-X7]|uniref:Transcriptional regulator, LuxR family protein n=1 Tax=Nostocoides japonicum T1-X7 TaxID=1194083 RepID=A0A077LT15_9MICO|nr:LuxR C-terminal-related transcriptional regulator [Tetrasphaera japonica]CCH76473.1 Transcriptional regulator, LuxR family protein [Tetrasphaera japonica T1-X7]
MPEPTGVILAGTAERDTLLATKLHAPATRAGSVTRSRLIDRLDESGVVAVCAPAGYGKTTLLADWVRGAEQAAWLSLDVGDNDPVRFWRHVSAALSAVRPRLGDRLDPMLGPPTPRSFEPVVTALVNELATPPTSAQMRLVLDDYHLIDSSQVHAGIEFLLEHRPPHLRLVLASRSDPPVALARLRARGELTELRAADLRFTTDEAAALLRCTVTTLPQTAVAALTARTEGWAAGLQLAALSLRGHEDVQSFVAAFTGSHRYILDYLTEEVLERQSERVRSFLLETALLERVSGPLCDAVTGRTDSQALLERLERSGLFLMPLDEVRGWWRYHHLFAEVLRTRLMHRRPDRALEIHRAAAGWYEQRGLADEAIQHALAARETTRAARLIERHFDGVFNLRGEEATIHRWLPALPEELTRRRPRLLLAQSQMAGMRGDIESMLPLIDAAERESLAQTDEPFEPAVGRASSLLVNVPAVIELQRSYIAQFRNDVEGTRTYAARAAALVRDDEVMLASTVEGFQAVAEWMRGRLGHAERRFAAGVARWRAAGELTHAAWGGYSLARIQCARGDLDAAAQTCADALRLTVPPGRSPLPSAGPAYAGLADVSYQRNDLDAAREHAATGIAVCRQFVYAPPLAACLTTMAFVRQARGDPDGALDAMHEAEHLSLGPPGLFNPVPAQRARLLLLQGDVAAAARWARESGLDAEDEPDYPREPGQVVLARVLLARQQPDQALALLERLYAAALGQGRIASVIETGALRALALAARGDDAAAVEALTDALGYAHPAHYIRVFVDEGRPMAELLTRLIGAQRRSEASGRLPTGYLADLHHAFAGDHEERSRAPLPGMIEALTDRELEVLELMAAGSSNQAIADALVVTLDTVKKHVSHILLKLAVTNRTEAAARARELHLIS